MAIKIHFGGPDAQAELASLYEWLRREPDIRQHADISLEGAAPLPVEMSPGSLGILQLILDDGFKAASLAIAFAAWRGSRARPPGHVTVSCGDVTVTLEGTDPETAAAIASIVSKDAGNA
jgi:hypothetical protein